LCRHGPSLARDRPLPSRNLAARRPPQTPLCNLSGLLRLRIPVAPDAAFACPTWDEGGYYIPARWVSPHRHADSRPTATNAHRRCRGSAGGLVHLSGFSSGTRTFICMVTAAASARSLSAGAWFAGTPRRRYDAAHRPLPGLVRAEHAGPRGHICGGVTRCGIVVLPALAQAPLDTPLVAKRRCPTTGGPCERHLLAGWASGFV